MVKEYAQTKHFLAKFEPKIHAVLCAFTSYPELQKLRTELGFDFLISEEKSADKYALIFTPNKVTTVTPNTLEYLVNLTSKYRTVKIDADKSHKKCTISLRFTEKMPNKESLTFYHIFPLSMPEFNQEVKKYGIKYRKEWAQWQRKLEKEKK